MIYLSLDLGTTTLGIAISDDLNIVHGLENFEFEKGNYKKARNHLREVIIKNNVYNLVIGFPIQLDGQIGKRGESVKRFVDDFSKENSDLNLNIYYQDERYSTLEAQERLKNSGLKENKINKIIDMYSAVVILEDFLKKHNN